MTFTGTREFPQGTQTAADAAAAIGCEVAQIVKSLVFVRQDGAPVLVLTSGANTVDTTRLGLEKADAGLVRDASGYAIGGVAPWGWRTAPAEVLVDEDLLTHEELWAAAGTPRHVFPTTATELLERTGGRVLAVRPPTAGR
jgi:prolyl-tRNA editing enzyme YbaK/EbsC (Cys-tRNA(Pro) deacylase)